MRGMDVSIIVKHGRQSYPLTINLSKGVNELKNSISSQTKIPPDLLTVILKRGVKVNRDSNLETLKISNGAKVTVMGQVESQWAKLMDVGRRLRVMESEVYALRDEVETDPRTDVKVKILVVDEGLTKLLLELDEVDVGACQWEQDVLRGRRKEMVTKVLELSKIYGEWQLKHN
eukprot:CFRG6965T1